MKKVKTIRKSMMIIAVALILALVPPLVTDAVNVNRSVRFGRDAQNRPWIQAILIVANSGRTHNVTGIASRASVDTGAATNWARVTASGTNVLPLPGGTTTTSTRATASTATSRTGFGHFEYRRQGEILWRTVSTMQVHF